MAIYTLTSSRLANSSTGLREITGSVDSTYIYAAVLTSALDEAYQATGQSGIEQYLTPLMNAAANAFYQYAGMNPTFHSDIPFEPRATGENYRLIPTPMTWRA
jgi:hypothetical protein